MTMIEKLASALAESLGEDAYSVDDTRSNFMGSRQLAVWEKYVPHIKKILQAMQEPTQAMINAGSETYIVYGAYGIDDVDLSIIYQTMIHTALEEKLP